MDKSTQRIVRGIVRTSIRERVARKSFPCTVRPGECFAYVASAEAAAVCLDTGRVDGPYHRVTTAGQRAYRAEKHGAMAEWAAARRVRSWLEAADEDE